MSLKHVIVAAGAAMSICLSGALCAGAQPAPVVEAGTYANQAAPVVEGAAPAPVAEDPAPPGTEGEAAVADEAEAQPGAAVDADAAPVTGPATDVQVAEDDAATAQEYKRIKMDEATAADDKFHANRTQANMIARDQAEAEAGAAISRAHAAQDRANAAKDRAARAGNRQ
ncbi:hypothetical protein [Candidatus Thiodictyon syntrophicum]|uniref:Uncharacterized protein n=1 Tax=Candidatus Thiodictyon syntrophicum TaxID=1166950 RepID=A0A2K8UA53_9GAMM|nr:hypothetical protein [Candidatus Thiodictyon syntrophicum]AUB82289.1 hypothetical protein THSYN_15925 [Candidatus Thiodictyon syntrophicum]